MYREIYMYVNAEWMVYTPILYHFPIHAYCSAIPIWSKWWFITHSWWFHLNWTGLFHSCEFCLSLAPALSLSLTSMPIFVFSSKILWNLYSKENRCRSPIFISYCVHWTFIHSNMYTDAKTNTMRFSWRVRQLVAKIMLVQCGKSAYMMPHTPIFHCTDISTDWLVVLVRRRKWNVLQ